MLSFLGVDARWWLRTAFVFVATAVSAAFFAFIPACTSSLSAEAETEVVEWVTRELPGQSSVIALPAGIVSVETLVETTDGDIQPSIESRPARHSVAFELTGETRIRLSTDGACGFQALVSPASGGGVAVFVDGESVGKFETPASYELVGEAGACPRAPHFRTALLQASFVQIGDQLVATTVPAAGEAPAWSGSLVSGRLSMFTRAVPFSARVLAAQEALGLGDFVEIGASDSVAAAGGVWGSVWLDPSINPADPILRVGVHTIGEPVLVRQAGRTSAYRFNASAWQLIAAQPAALLVWFILSGLILWLGFAEKKKGED